MRALNLISVLALLGTLAAEAQPSNNTAADEFEQFSDPGYTRLLEAQEAYEAIVSAGGWPAIPAHDVLRPGEVDSRIPLLRRRLMVSRDLGAYRADSLYDESLEEAVRLFQWRHGLEVDGIVGRQTFAALNVSAEKRLAQIELNLERRQQHTDTLGDRVVIVNIPGFALDVLEKGRTMLSSRVIVGKQSTRTPRFSSHITEVILAPYWNVPTSIATNEILPRLRRDQGYLARNHIRRLPGGGLRQDPGPGNPLGAIKFTIPNRYSVGLHDTPEKSLFAATHCAFSHGCMRLQRPLDLAVYLLRGTAWTSEAIQQTIELWRETRIPVPNPPPFHVVYWTAFVDEAGIVHFPPDIYGYDIFPEAAASGQTGGEVVL